VSGYAGLLVFLAFIGAMVWISWMSWRRSQYGGVSEVSASDQADLAQTARAVYADGQIASSSEFDGRVLGLLDSIEMNRDDIDLKLQELRSFLKAGKMWERLKERQKLGLMYANSAAYLARSSPTAGKRQLMASWRMVGSLGSGSGEVSHVPKSWIRPLAGDPGAAPLATGYKPSRKVVTPGRTVSSLVAGLTFSVTGAMVASIFTHDSLTVFEWFLGIFLAIVILYRTPLVKFK
jgi:hypothetical protein